MRKKRIEIHNDREYKKFLRRITLYKHMFYRNTLFIIDSNIHDPNINYIVEALNIKKRKDRIQYVYDKSCEMIDEKGKEKNICGFKNHKCYVQRETKSKACNGCCKYCMYQTKNGCPTKNLACKLFNCSEVTSRHDVVKYRDLKILKLLSLKNRFIVKSDYFSTREDVLKDLYSYSVIYSTCRILYRWTKNDYFFSRKQKRKKRVNK